ncbi:MAG: succinate dehydrogenase, cytochrome b556 subunit [Gammaproteobacteria bacterium]|nr:succinate dehydrogenase, cytochrome b556 subunit [Gammaproteobacteria bacterium]NIN61749.1 succinate dehydrogenase, cytochrome b556 subunit [Gammaproteobacteria bacterium]NIO62899.1 succinate dehydrogenase, cytochrome b556 subunit [Gammaproteobacteria bacterium]NIQ08147.1 succinate dehydrogenase, cytochrome b556 subunit [Gammaproteobacteria bacterium]NIQ19463.1 succinate dehydrogenase, cytochrome b556 subunit [Gammaproteobacteria bacterium]
MATVNRPLSPHLQIYKPQLTSLLSITHRGTGVFLSIGALFLSCWLLSVANGPESYQTIQNHILAWYGQTLLYAWVFSLYYHLCNGIRHLFWDIGLGLELKTTYISGYAVVILSVLMTAVTWYLACGVGT